MHGHRITQVGIIVRDLVRTVQNYSRLFGVGPWTLSDLIPTGVVLHDQRPADGDACVRAATAYIGHIQIELLQPLYGPSTHMEFMCQKGEGIHHVSFGRVDNHDEVVSTLQRQGVAIEMQGTLWGAGRFTYMDTCRELGTIVEFGRAPDPGVQSKRTPWGELAKPISPVVNMTGKQIAKISIVVNDAEGIAQRYEELLGIGPWQIQLPAAPPTTNGWVMYGIPMVNVTARTKIAVCEWEGLQLELIQPLEGPSTHWEYLKTRGNGVHHLSFGPVEDHDALLEAFAAGGISIEAMGRLSNDCSWTHMDTHRELGTIYEILQLPK
jgi:hypothetical protein